MPVSIFSGSALDKLAALKSVSTLVQFAPLLGQPPSAVAYTLYKIPAATKYSTFSIPKKNGGTRQISAPTKRLKDLQKSLAELLTDCRNELHAKDPHKIISHGFRTGASISTNARQHLNRRYVLNVDLENFFPTFNFGRVRGFFIKNKGFALNDKVATVIAQIACDGKALPQGSPCSPIISDLLAHILDVRLVQFAKAHKCTYSRYADDLTFSTNRRSFPEAIARQLEDSLGTWVASDGLLDQISRAGFALNHKKTRMQYRGSRQVVTGLTVNKKVNVRSDYYRSTRLMCSALFATGAFYPHGAQPVAGGKPPSGTLNQLEGILNHIYHIKRTERARTGIVKNPQKPQGIERLYERFLFYRKFVALDKPTIICEGETDSIYLNAALRHLPAYAGVLFNVVSGKKQSAIRFFKYSKISEQILDLAGGTSHFVRFIHRYGKLVNRFEHAPLSHPVILACTRF